MWQAPRDRRGQSPQRHCAQHVDIAQMNVRVQLPTDRLDSSLSDHRRCAITHGV
jgi:hypothetical protein